MIARLCVGLSIVLVWTAVLAGQGVDAGVDQAASARSDNAGFVALLDEAELRFVPPDGFVDLPAGRTPMLDYERALRSADGDLEIRIAVRPLKRLQIDYDDPHGAVPNPNHIFPLVFESLATRLAGGGHAPSSEYPPDQARAKFNADWAAAAVFDTVDDFATGYKQGLLVALHRNKVSDAYIVFLFDDYATVKGRLKEVMGTVGFVPPEPVAADVKSANDHGRAATGLAVGTGPG